MPIRFRLPARIAPLDLAGMASLALTVAALPYAAAVAQPMWMQGLPYTVVESGKQFSRLQDAIYAIGDGQGTIRIAPGRWQDCAAQEHGTIAYVAEVPGKTVLEKQICEGKAGLVLRGRGARVEGIVFSDYRSVDGNAAGIRLEKGPLSVSQAWFRNSEQGILTGNDPKAAITIDKSTFTRLGRCDRGLACAHSIYTGNYGSVTVTRSRFEAGNGGHYLKSRSGHVTVSGNVFDDSQGHATNYMIDLPAGADGRISGNWFAQGPDKENPGALIAIAAESHDHKADGLAIEGNVARFAKGASHYCAFVADWSGDALAIGANTLANGIERFQRRF